MSVAGKDHPMTKHLFAAALAAFAMIGAAEASGAGAHKNKVVEWSFNGPFGTYDKDALQRGFQVYRTVCASCHAVEQLSFRNLGDKGGPYHLDECPEGGGEGKECRIPANNPIIKALAAEYEVTDGPDDSGDMFKRSGVPADKFPRPYANAQQARAANGGALPPNLALIIKARADGANYVYSLLTGYEEPPQTVQLAPGQYYNPYFAGDMSQLLKAEYRDEEGHAQAGVEIPAGGVLAMKSPLSDGIVDYADAETPETVDQYAKDVVQFLAWASEPKMEERKSLGVVTMGYLLILSLILFFSYRAIWSKVGH
jgi:ubiquinol-cytochrome c reductase cytochrome c1 subunit